MCIFHRLRVRLLVNCFQVWSIMTYLLRNYERSLIEERLGKVRISSHSIVATRVATCTVTILHFIITHSYSRLLYYSSHCINEKVCKAILLRCQPSSMFICSALLKHQGRFVLWVATGRPELPGKVRILDSQSGKNEKKA